MKIFSLLIVAHSSLALTEIIRVRHNVPFFPLRTWTLGSLEMHSSIVRRKKLNLVSCHVNCTQVNSTEKHTEWFDSNSLVWWLPPLSLAPNPKQTRIGNCSRSCDFNFSIKRFIRKNTFWALMKRPSDSCIICTNRDNTIEKINDSYFVFLFSHFYRHSFRWKLI